MLSRRSLIKGLSLSAPALFLTACGVGTVNETTDSSSESTGSGAEPTAANESEHLTALHEAEQALRNDAIASPKELTGTATAQAVAEVLPLENPQTPSLPITITDAQGTEVTVENVDRILALDLYGTLAQTVIALGLGDRLVGRVTSSTEASLQDLPLVTENGHDLNAEAIIALAPSIILMDTTNGPLEVTEQLRSAGMTVVHCDPKRSMDKIVPQIQFVADALGVSDAGRQLSERVQAEIDSALATIKEVAPSDEAQKVSLAFLYVRGTAGVFFILGEGSGADDLMSALGGIDAASVSGAKGTTPATSEALVMLNPDVILTMTAGIESTGGIEGFIARPGVGETTAGKNQRIIDMSDGQILSFGPNYAAVLLSLAHAVYAQGNQG